MCVCGVGREEGGRGRAVEMVVVVVGEGGGGGGSVDGGRDE